MYICICNKVTDTQIKNAVDEGASTIDDLRTELGVASQCGQCGNCAKTLINEYTAAHSIASKVTQPPVSPDFFPFFTKTAYAHD